MGFAWTIDIAGSGDSGSGTPLREPQQRHRAEYDWPRAYIKISGLRPVLGHELPLRARRFCREWRGA